MKLSLLTLPVALVATCAAAAPSLPGPAFPNYPTPDALGAACEKGLESAQARVRSLERHAPDQRWLAAYDALNAFIEDSAGPIYLLSNVHPDKSMRDASEKCEARWQDFYSTLGQNETLFQAARRIRPRDAIDRELIKTTLEGFEDSGVALHGTARARAKRINDRLDELRQQFDKNIRDEGVQVAFAEDELKGVPEGVWKDTKRDDQGRLLLGLDYPTYDPVMQGAESEAARERMWRAKLSEGGAANLKLLAEVVALRKEYAALFGLRSYDDFTLRRRMVQTTERVLAFLDEVKAAVTERERRELAELSQAKAHHLGSAPQAVKFNRWDAAFYTERVRRERYGVDQETFRPYFPPQQSLQFALRVVEQMMGVKYTRVNDVRLWHPEVQAYAVSDAASGKPLASLLVDLYPRDGKYNHAAVWGYRNSAQRVPGNGARRNARTAQAALVVNFDRKGLTLEELETLLHELGHAVHNNLSATRYSAQAGTSVLRDFVEAPSQMLESWVYDRRVIDVFKQVCPACKPVPDELLAQAKAAKGFAMGVLYGRQRLFASYDIALYGPDAPEPMALWAQLETATPLGHVPGSQFPAGFSHVVSGYAAGYYGYLWSEVVAFDLRTAFANDKLDPAVGERYRRIVLANGSQRPPLELVQRFLGRATNAKAFFDGLQQP